MKILVCADSHGSLYSLYNAIDAEKPDYIFHLGDYTSDADTIHLNYPQIPLTAVRGNCDMYADEPDRLVFDFMKHRFFLCHGHRYNVKGGLLRLQYAAMEERADIVLFGHTHIPFYSEENGLYMLNPGSCSGFGSSTCAVITLDGGAPAVQIKYLGDYKK